MKGRIPILLMMIIPTILFSRCDQAKRDKTSDNYQDTIQEWRKNRVKNLKSPEGWLNLAGLYWLEKGKNTIGSDSTHDVVFPEKAPSKVGTVFLNDGNIRFTAQNDVKVYHKDILIDGMQLKSDADDDPTVLKHGSLKWFVIKRGEKYAVRLRDLESPLLDKLSDIPAFPAVKKWRKKATFIPYQESKTIDVPNVLGGTNQEESPGMLKFEHNDETYTLQALGSRKSLFIVFGDDTNAEETYGGGRFLVAGEPNDDNITHLDFNKAYNPPCAFTPYATCPLPPKANRLPFKVKAGEKKPGMDVPHH